MKSRPEAEGTGSDMQRSSITPHLIRRWAALPFALESAHSPRNFFEPEMLSRRDVLKTGVFAGAGALLAPVLDRPRHSLFADELEVSARALDLVGRATVIDMLGLFTLDWPKLYTWMREPARF